MSFWLFFDLLYLAGAILLGWSLYLYLSGKEEKKSCIRIALIGVAVLLMPLLLGALTSWLKIPLV